MKNPLISAIMALETFMEAARLLYPYLVVSEVREVQFLEAIEVPPEVGIEVDDNLPSPPEDRRWRWSANSLWSRPSSPPPVKCWTRGSPTIGRRWF